MMRRDKAPFWAWRAGLRNAFRLSGRAPRMEFWWFALLGVPVAGLLSGLYWIIDELFVARGLFGPASLLELLAAFVLLAFVVPAVTVSVRRFHDVGLSGWWVACLDCSLLLIPLMVSALVMAELNAQLMLVTAVVGGGAQHGWPEQALRLFVVALVAIKAVVGCLPSQRGPNRFGPEPKRRIWAPDAM